MYRYLALTTATLLFLAIGVFALVRTGRVPRRGEKHRQGVDETTASAAEIRAHLPKSARGPMWDRLSLQARQAVYYATDAATSNGDSQVAPEHLLLGVIRDGDTITGRIFDRLAIPVGEIRSRLQHRMNPGKAPPHTKLQLTTDGKRVIDYAYREARQLGSEYIGAQQLLVGLIEVGGSTKAVLQELGVDLERTRQLVREHQQ